MIRKFVSVQDRKKRKTKKKRNYQFLASGFFPVNPEEFTPMMESGPRGQIKSFQCRTFHLFISPEIHCWQKCHDYDHKAKQLTLRAQDTAAVNPLGSRDQARPCWVMLWQVWQWRWVSPGLQLEAGCCQGGQGPQPPETALRRRRKRKAFMEVTVPPACRSLGAPAATARPGPAFPSVVPMTHVHMLAALPPGVLLGQTQHSSWPVPEGGSGPPEAQPGVAPPSRGGRCTGRPVGQGRGVRPDTTHRRREPDSVGAFYFKVAGCWVVGFPFPLSTLLKEARDQPFLVHPGGRAMSLAMPGCLPGAKGSSGPAPEWPHQLAHVLPVGWCGQHTRGTERGSYGPAH